MNFIEKATEKWNTLCEKTKPARQATARAMGRFGKAMKRFGHFIYAMRKVFAAIPVGVAAVLLAIYNQAHLPPVVGLGLQNDGTFSLLLARELAVLGPVAVTAVCLLMMFASKKILTPWLVSLFSLAVPLVVLLTNSFPN